VLAADAGRSEPPPHALNPERRHTSWAIDCAHWRAGRYVSLSGRVPARLVPAPTWSAIEAALSRELEHLERHVEEGDDDPVEATYAICYGSRILYAIETGDVAISKRAGGMWALEHLPERWHEAIRAAGRAYDGEARRPKPGHPCPPDDGPPRGQADRSSERRAAPFAGSSFSPRSPQCASVGGSRSSRSTSIDSGWARPRPSG
jgi:hypothetical protein